MSRAVLLCLLAMVALCLAACTSPGLHARASRKLELAVPWQDYDRIAVRTDNGRVALRGSDVADVLIDAELYVQGPTAAEARTALEALELRAKPAPGHPRTLLVELVVPGHLANRSPGATISITLPQDCTADVKTSNGAIHAENLAGDAALESNNGAVRVADVLGTLSVETSNGRVDVQRVAGDCVVRTSNGGIKVVDASGSLDIRTTNGSIHASASPPTTAAVTLRASNGSIDATLCASLSAAVELRTSNGTVSADFGSATVSNASGGRQHLRADLNDAAGGRVSAHTSNGSVRMRFR
jgi:hypothetical protein